MKTTSVMTGPEHVFILCRHGLDILVPRLPSNALVTQSFICKASGLVLLLRISLNANIKDLLVCMNKSSETVLIDGLRQRTFHCKFPCGHSGSVQVVCASHQTYSTAFVGVLLIGVSEICG